LPSRSPRECWIPCAHSENRSGLARWAGLDPEVSIQTSHAYQEDDRPLCPTWLHITSIAGAVVAHLCPTRLQRFSPPSIEGRGERPGGTGLLASPLSDQDPVPLTTAFWGCRSRGLAADADLILVAICDRVACHIPLGAPWRTPLVPGQAGGEGRRPRRRPRRRRLAGSWQWLPGARRARLPR